MDYKVKFDHFRFWYMLKCQANNVTFSALGHTKGDTLFTCDILPLTNDNNTHAIIEVFVVCIIHYRGSFIYIPHSGS